MDFHGGAGSPRIAIFDRREDRRVLVLDEAEAGIGAQHREIAGEIHADGDVRLERELHGDMVMVVGRPGDRLVKARIRVDAEPAGPDAGLERLVGRPDVEEIGLLPALGGEGRRGAFEADAEFEAALDVGDRSRPGRNAGPRRPDGGCT